MNAERSRAAKPRDLFGAERKKRPYLSTSLSRADRNTFERRLERLQYLHKIFPRGFSYLLPPETHLVFSEIQSAYIAGLSVAVVLLTQAFIEHYYQLCLQNTRAANRGLAGIIDYLRKHRLEYELILKRIDKLRLVRNPFTHLKPFEHPYTISQRALNKQKNPLTLLEEDAKDSLDATLAIIQHSKLRR